MCVGLEGDRPATRASCHSRKPRIYASLLKHEIPASPPSASAKGLTRFCQVTSGCAGARLDQDRPRAQARGGHVDRQGAVGKADGGAVYSGRATVAEPRAASRTARLTPTSPIVVLSPGIGPYGCQTGSTEASQAASARTAAASAAPMTGASTT